MPLLELNYRDEFLDYLIDIKMEKRVISWYATKNASSSESGYSGQDKSCLRYLHLPENLDNVHFNLNLSHPDDDFQVQRYDETENITDILSWIKDFGTQDSSFAEAEFICHAHHLAMMMTLPFQSRFGLSLHVEYFDGKFYLRRIVNAKNFHILSERLDDPSRKYSAMRTRQGLKLESYLYSESPSGKPEPSKPYTRGSASKSFVVLNCSVGENKLLYSSSAVKCLDNVGNLQTLDETTFAGARTSPETSSSSVYWSKWLEWWSHAMLGEVNRTLIAYLPDPADGIVSNLESFNEPDLLRNAQKSCERRQKNSPKFELKKACIKNLHDIISFIKSTMSGAVDGDVFELRYEKTKPREVWMRKIYVSSKLEVVPDWFKEWVTSNKRTPPVK